MSAAKFTAGPWATWQGFGARDIAIRPVVGGRVMPLTLARVFTASVAKKDEADANATLIAAAPDLLEALQWLVDILPDPELDNDELQRVWTTKARAAIAKATGGAA